MRSANQRITLRSNLREYRKLKTKRKAVAIVVLTKSSPTPVRYTYSPYKPHLHPLHLTQNVNKYFLTCINKEETSFSTVVVDFSDLVREFLY